MTLDIPPPLPSGSGLRAELGAPSACSSVHVSLRFSLCSWLSGSFHLTHSPCVLLSLSQFQPGCTAPTDPLSRPGCCGALAIHQDSKTVGGSRGHLCAPEGGGPAGAVPAAGLPDVREGVAGDRLWRPSPAWPAHTSGSALTDSGFSFFADVGGAQVLATGESTGAEIGRCLPS